MHYTNWNDFHYSENENNESNFIIGLDLGDSTSVFSFYNFTSKSPEVIDTTGGYGKTSVPTLVQYNYDSDEWIFGEYAVLNMGVSDEITFDRLISGLGSNKSYKINKDVISHKFIVSLFIKELFSNIKNINPNAEIVGIVVAVDMQITEDAKSELEEVFSLAGISESFIKFIDSRTSLLTLYNSISQNKAKKILVLDYGFNNLRGSIFESHSNHKYICLNNKICDEISISEFDLKIFSLLQKYFLEESNKTECSEQEIKQLKTFTYQHKDLILQKASTNKLKLFYNFTYPPIQKTVNSEDIDNVIKPYEKIILLFLESLFSEECSFNDIDAVLLTGGGFEMSWARKIVEAVFNDKLFGKTKESKDRISLGACISAAANLNVCENLELEISDDQKLKSDIGVYIKENNQEFFYPLIKKDSYWWQTHPKKCFIINEEIQDNYDLKIYTRNDNEQISLLNSILISNLPIRPKGTLKVEISINYKSKDILNATIEDCGFGEFFPKTSYKKDFDFNIKT